MELTCDACGMEISEGDAFCGECGERIAWEAETVVAADDQPLAQSPPPPPPVAPQAAAPPSPQAQVCGNCGGGLTAGENFCPWCGSPRGAAPPPPPPQGHGAPGGQPAGAERAAAVFNQGSNEVSERVAKTWNDALMRLPLLFLGAMVVGFFLISDVSDLSITYPVVLGGVIFVLLILHTTSATIGDGPILGAAGIALVLSVLASVLGTAILVAFIASDGASFGADVADDESVTVAFGGALSLVGSVGLFLTTLRAYVKGLISQG